MTAHNVDSLNWASSNALVTISGHGSTTKMRALLQLQGWTGGPKRGLEIQFAVLPLLGGGGDSASSLFQASRGGDMPPWNDQDPFRWKPIFRNVFQNELHAINDKIDISTWEIRLWNISCSRQAVWRYRGHLSNVNPVQSCAQYAPGWRQEAGGTGTTAVVADNFESRLGDRCEVGSSPCVCAQMTGCSWRDHSAGGKRCLTTAGGVTSCEHCSQQAACSSAPDCSSAKDACRCAAVPGLFCKWDESQATCSQSHAEQVPCSACWMQASCASGRPQATDLSGVKLVGYSGDEAQLIVKFSTFVEIPSAAEGSLMCAEPGKQVEQGQVSAMYTLKKAAMSIVSNNLLVLNMSTVRVPQETFCTVLLPEGTVVNQSRGPSVPVAFQDLIVSMPDGLAPRVIKYSPESGAQGVKLATTTATLTFDEPVSRGQFSATLTPLAAIGEAPDRSKDRPIPFKSVRGNAVDLDLTGMLAEGKLYQITLPRGSVQDMARHPFEGVPDEGWTFTAEGVDIKTQVVSNDISSTPWITIGAICGSVVAVAFLAFVAWRLWAINSKMSSKVVPHAGGETSSSDSPHSPPQAYQNAEVDVLAVAEKPNPQQMIPKINVASESGTQQVKITPMEQAPKQVKQDALDSLMSSMDTFDEPERRYAFTDDGPKQGEAPQLSDSNHLQVSESGHHNSSQHTREMSHHGASNRHGASHHLGPSPRTSPRPSLRTSPKPSPRLSSRSSPHQSPTPSPRLMNNGGHSATHHSGGQHFHLAAPANPHRPLTLKDQLDQAKQERAMKEALKHSRG
eukprot:TRINITY_DN107603_c0_g1_i1.p1 TRINITY_DN107603_c0_g1~~TRINITY_DN107603_c0_g1_i1.p1  ORF type:complete len:870 (-),score=104.40 TRINITY_DN107603_c0_g1_i1:41-2413(-)